MLFELLWYFKSTFRWDSFAKGMFQGFIILLITYPDALQVASCKDRGRQFILTLLSHSTIEFSFSLPYDYIVRRIKEQNI